MAKSQLYTDIELTTWERPKPRLKTWAEIAAPRPEPFRPPVHAPQTGLKPATSAPAMKSRARKKWLSQNIAGSLKDLNSPLKFKYMRTLTCGDEIRQEGNVFTSRYCGCRWCVVCQSIRMGKMINKYREIIDSLDRPHMVTLTVRNIISKRYDTGGQEVKPSDVLQLRKTQRQMFKHFRKLQDGLRKYGVKLKGFRKYEVIVSKDCKGYHPHIHWIVSTSMNVDLIVKLWKVKKLPGAVLQKCLKQFEAGTITHGQLQGEFFIQLWLREFEGYSDRKGQDVRPARKGSEVELFKYTTKMIVSSKNSEGKTEKEVPLQLLDNIYQATEKVRTIQCTGFITRKPVKPKFDYTKVPHWKMQKFEAEFLIMGYSTLTASEYEYVKQFEKNEKAYNLQLVEYLTYKEFTEAEEAEVTEDLTAQTAHVLTPQNDVFVWHGDNWFSINTGQPLVKWAITNCHARFIEAFNSG